MIKLTYYHYDIFINHSREYVKKIMEMFQKLKIKNFIKNITPQRLDNVAGTVMNYCLENIICLSAAQNCVKHFFKVLYLYINFLDLK